MVCPLQIQAVSDRLCRCDRLQKGSATLKKKAGVPFGKSKTCRASAWLGHWAMYSISEMVPGSQSCKIKIPLQKNSFSYHVTATALQIAIADETQNAAV
jgi:hypothetical protein